MFVKLASNVCDAENSDGTCLDDTALVWEKRSCAGGRKATSTVLKVARVIVRSGLVQVSYQGIVDWASSNVVGKG